jgi:diguanylate cyclase (GGDEF)-like protein
MNELEVEHCVQLTANETTTSLINECCHLISALVQATSVTFVPADDAVSAQQPGVTTFDVAKENIVFGRMVVKAPHDVSARKSQIYPVTALLANQLTLLNRCARDLLTGLYNRQALDDRLKEVFTHTEQHNKRRVIHQRVLAVIDIDHFKKINDTYGHLYGDEILVLFSGLLKETFRAEDWLFRYGGDEFVIIMNDTSVSDAKAIIERLQQRVSGFKFPAVEKVTLSIGYTLIDHKAGIGEVFDRADHALYWIKKQGRNGACSYEALAEQGDGKQSAYDGGVELF